MHCQLHIEPRCGLSTSIQCMLVSKGTSRQPLFPRPRALTLLLYGAQTSIECMLIIEEVSPMVCRQTLEGDVNIRIPGLGSIAERIIRQSLKDVYSNIPQVVERCAASGDTLTLFLFQSTP